MLRLIISTFFIAGIFAIILEDGPCPDIPIEQIDLCRMSGMWYSYKHSQNVEVPLGRCARLTWSVPVNGVSTLIFSHISDRDHVNSTTIADIRLANNIISLDLQLPVVGSFKGDYHIIETDYDNYAVVLACQPVGSQHSSFVWIITRDPKPKICGKIENAFKKRCLKVPQLQSSNITGCYEEKTECHSRASSRAFSSSSTSTSASTSAS